MKTTEFTKLPPTKKANEYNRAYSRNWFVFRVVLVELFPELFPVIMKIKKLKKKFNYKKLGIIAL